MRTQRTSLTLINRLLDVIKQLEIFQYLTIEVHIGPGLMYYLLPELLSELRNICPPGTEVGLDSIGRSFTYCGNHFIVNDALANGFSIRINGGLAVDYTTR